MSLAAVFSPTPGTPGRLSEGSPRSAAYCGYSGGRDAGALLDAGLVVVRVVGDAALDVEHPHVRVLDELVGVAVAGEDEDVVARLAALRGQRGDDVVGLEPGRLEDRDPQGLEDLAHEAHLLAEDVGRRVAVALVGADAARGGRSAAGRSKATAMASGFWSFRMFTSIDVNPNTALVTCPDAVARSVGSAKKAR